MTCAPIAASALFGMVPDQSALFGMVPDRSALSGPERVVRTGIGPVEVRRQKVRDRATGVPGGAKVGFTSDILPKWAPIKKSRGPAAGALPARHLRR